MVDNFKGFTSPKEAAKLFVTVIIVALILLAGYALSRFLFSSLVLNSTSNYAIENDYYGFELQTPKSWIAEANTAYSQDNIAQLLVECKNDKSSGTSYYEIGRFRFKNQKYPYGFGDAGNFATGFPSGAIMDITVDCLPNGIKDKATYYNYINLKTGGEKTFEEFLDLAGFGKTKYLSFLHNNFQYKINEYVYVSPEDKKNEVEIRNSYTGVFNKIISSFKFTK